MANNIYDMVMSRKSDSNIRFTDFRNMILSYGFRERIRGDVRMLVEKYGLFIRRSYNDDNTT